MTTFQDSNPLDRFPSSLVWRCGDGRRVRVKVLTDDHLRNIQRKLATFTNDVRRAICDFGHRPPGSENYGVAEPVAKKTFEDLEELWQNIADWAFVITREIAQREEAPSYHCHSSAVPIISGDSHLPHSIYQHEHLHKHTLGAPSHHTAAPLSDSQLLADRDGWRDSCQGFQAQMKQLHERLKEAKEECACWRGKFHGLEARLKIVKAERDRWRERYRSLRGLDAEVPQCHSR